MKKIDQASGRRPGFEFDLDDLLHPAKAFGNPRKVVDDPDLTLNEKRAILASWASDACAIEAAPALRQVAGAPHPIPFDEIMDAMRALDRQADSVYRAPPRYREILKDRTPGVFGRRSRHRTTSFDRSQSLN